MDLVGVERVKEYAAAEDADITLQLKHVLYPMVKRIGLHDLYVTSRTMIDVLAEIEEAGCASIRRRSRSMPSRLNRKLGMLENAIRDEAGEPSLNINSTRQLGEVLFGKCASPKPKMTKTKQFCTDEGTSRASRTSTASSTSCSNTGA